ncbi:Elongator subunit elp2 [Oleoguttula sp. CCFEE 5521]
MTSPPRLEFLAAGGNRHPSAADWVPGLLAFGAGNSIALWNPDDPLTTGITALLNGHTDTVNAVKIVDAFSRRFLISGSSDTTIRIWHEQPRDQYPPFREWTCVTGHSGAVNSIAPLTAKGIFASGAADGTVKVWQIGAEGVALVQSISLKPRFLPLALALVELSGDNIVLAAAGTTASIQLYGRHAGGEFELQATLTGHDGWIRSLNFLPPDAERSNDILLASASQDKYVRLWRMRKDDAVTANGTDGSIIKQAKVSLSNKTQHVGFEYGKYAVAFEALLVGHEDWIYSARWLPRSDRTAQSAPPTLLTASADNSIAMWSVAEASGLWMCNTRLGEISSQKGSTTATGSTGGFWIGLWGPNGTSIASLGRTGSWRRWSFDKVSDTWDQALGVSGHTQDVAGVSWAPDGSYLLTTSHDQTTRLFAQWIRGDDISWHEVARPQIHGYDLNCIATTSPHQFVSGADEKLLRVFDTPKPVDRLIRNLENQPNPMNGHAIPDTDEDTTESLALPETAAMPVLGLSNKAIPTAETDADATTETADDPSMSLLPTATPSHEFHLARHTLYPEREKLYGHGHEISCVAASPTHPLIATACRASSLDHAVIRIYNSDTWREVKPPLEAHSLTVTDLSFSADGKWLLSVGRDRQWVLWRYNVSSVADPLAIGVFVKVKADVKGHARMILSCAWAPSRGKSGSDQAEQYVFATASRDKSVKIWRLQPSSPSAKDFEASETEVTLLHTLKATSAVTAVAFSATTCSADSMPVTLAFGTETGEIGLCTLAQTSETTDWPSATVKMIDRGLCPSKSITALRFRPGFNRGPEMLAIGSEDSSVRLLTI